MASPPPSSSPSGPRLLLGKPAFIQSGCHLEPFHHEPHLVQLLPKLLKVGLDEFLHGRVFGMDVGLEMPLLDHDLQIQPPELGW